MELTQIDFTQYLVLVTVIAGVTELITRLRAKDYWVVATIASAAVVGAIFGAIGYYPGVDAGEGIAYALGASGLITIVGARKSVAAPSSVTKKVTDK